MTDPGKVQGFLDLSGAWDPSLAFVMGGAIAVGFFAFALAQAPHHAASWAARCRCPRRATSTSPWSSAR